MRTSLLVGLSLLLAGCRSPTPAAASTAPTTVATPGTGSPRAPLAVTWSVVEQTGSRHQLELTITKLVQTELPLTVKLQLPDGARLEPASLSWSVDPQTTGALRYPLTVSWSGDAPAQDLIASVDMQGASAGFHAEVPYRFGRPAPTAAELKRSAQPVQLGNTNLGQPVDLTK